MHDFDPYLTWLEIPPQERPADHYRLLGIGLFESDPARISAAADARMAHLRTFQAGPRGAYTQPLLNEVARAKLCLLDPHTKQAYDQVLGGRISPGEPAPPPRIAVPPPVPPPQLIDGMMITPMTAEEAAQSAAAAFVRPARVAEAAQRRRTRHLPLGPIIAGLMLLVVLLGGLGILLSRMTSADRVVEVTPEEKPPAETLPPAIAEASDGSVTLPASAATIHENAARLETQGGRPALVGWESEAEGWVSWDFEISNPGFFVVEMTYRVEPEWAGGRYRLSIDEQAKDTSSRDTDGQFVTEEVFFMVVPKTGRHTLNIRTGVLAGDDLMSLQSIRLVPRNRG